MPVHEGMHWTAALVDVAHKRLVFFDSLCGRNTMLADCLARWVADEAKVRTQQAACAVLRR